MVGVLLVQVLNANAALMVQPGVHVTHHQNSSSGAYLGYYVTGSDFPVRIVIALVLSVYDYSLANIQRI